MIHLSTIDQSRKIDQAVEKYDQFSAEMFMESAGALSAQEILRNSKLDSALVLCGPGHNGGDGLVTARHLLSEGVEVHVFADDTKSSLVQKQKKRLEQFKISIYSIKNLNLIKEKSKKVGVLIDALFGAGLSKNIEGLYCELIQWMNSLKEKKVVSLDIPSGLHGDTGQVKGEAVQADFTLSFGLAKPGFYLMRGPEHTGNLKVFSIGFPQSLLKETANTHFLLDENWVFEKMPCRRPEDHKAKHGHLLVLAGSEGFWGAGQLCALSAYRMGAGYVTWAGGNGKEHPPLGSVPEILTQKLNDLDLFSNKKAVALGPGLLNKEKVKDLLIRLKKLNVPVALDASAFVVCVREKLFPLPSHWILTPHSGELGHLFKLEGKKIDQDRCSYALQASQKAGCPVLLKGFHSVLAFKNQCWIVPSGNSALAKAGTGDVLTGFIGALMVRSLSSFQAGAVGAFIHGCLADEWVLSGKNPETLMAQDLKELLPFVLNKMKKRTV